jgi:uncharacterized damage-inducible protein DinB
VPTVAAPERLDPPLAASEKDMLSAWLEYHRATMLRKVDGGSDEDLRRPMVPSGTNLLSLVKHVGWVECYWFQMNFAGREVENPWTEDDPDADFRVEPHETTDDVLRFYREQCATNRAIVESAESLDQPSARLHGRRREQMTLRWILVHMIEETARHNGHVDILREMIDGATGE